MTSPGRLRSPNIELCGTPAGPGHVAGTAAVLSRIPDLVCPTCKNTLLETPAALVCSRCPARFPVHDGIPNMLSRTDSTLEAEIELQDELAMEYETVRYKDPISRAYHDWWSNLMTSRMNVSGPILDNGCGIGQLLAKLPRDRVVGLDISAGMLRSAARYSDRLILGNCQQLPFRDGSFSGVFCRSLLHHLERPELAVREMARVLADEGVVCIVETNTSILSALPRWIVYRGSRFSEFHVNLGRRRLKQLLRPYFQVDEMFCFGFVAYPLLGFPDLVGIIKRAPGRAWLARGLMAVDRVCARVPVLRTQGWAVLATAVRRRGA